MKLGRDRSTGCLDFGTASLGRIDAATAFAEPVRSFRACSQMTLFRKFTHVLAALGLFAIGSTIGGCANVITSNTVDNCRPGIKQNCDGYVPTGFVYSLPKGRLLLTASRKQVSVDDVAKAQAASGAAAAAVAKDLATIASAQAALAKDTTAGATPAAIATDNSAIATATAQQQADAIIASAAAATYNSLNSNIGKWQEAATITQLSTGPDPSRRYAANLNHWVTRDDTLKLDVVNGMLTSTSATSVDETPNLLIALADTVITASSMGALPVVPAIAAAPGPVTCGYDLAAVFDPLDPADRARVIHRLSSSNASFGLQFDGTADLANSQHVPSGSHPGLVYRVATTVVVSTRNLSDLRILAACPLVAPVVSQSLLAVVPDTRTEFIVSSVAGPFTTTNLTYGFSNGMLTDYTDQRPSELAAIANVPVRIANDLISIPTSILQLRVSYDTAAAAAVNAKTTLMTSQLNQSTAVENARTSLRTAENSLIQAELAGPVTTLNGKAAIVNARAALDQADQALAKAAAASAPASPIAGK